jgi:CBS-domain-containing membrane protein
MDTEPVAIADDTTVDRALDEFFLRYQWPWFPVTDAAHRFVGLIVREAADAVPDSDRATMRVGELLESDTAGTLQVSADAPLDSLLGNDALRRLGALAAVDPDGRLRGIVTAEQIGRALRDAMAEPPPAT